MIGTESIKRDTSTFNGSEIYPGAYIKRMDHREYGTLVAVLGYTSETLFFQKGKGVLRIRE